MVQELTRKEIEKQMEDKDRETHEAQWPGEWQQGEESGSDGSEQRGKKSEPRRRSEKKREESNQNLVFAEMLKLIKEERSLRSPKREKDEEEGEKEEQSETIKTAVTFPVLKGVSEAPDPALRCGDWLATVRIKVSTMSKTADKYWNRIFEDATRLYERFLDSGTLERLILKFDGLEN